ncbi:MAG: prephenate dehydrogenase/arogenate dehydrogenase family protein [Deltaproteobacteria bacterium HGW-Deltaproteobacteria-6]|jgi:prephenate dehydrogenase|nr:MAG: prephenate dehydrogenase/arogenate dehydrogenase family protein [Deltaproteobacteria bacterium HGW-Deltaproteobacteria-6]
MKKITVGIIGGTNGMGRWLADLLAGEGCTVHVTGRKTVMTAKDAANVCDVVVVSVPIAATAGVIAEVGPLLKKSQLLMDLTSLKKEPVALMLAHSDACVVGCHPLFGPSISSAAGHNIVLSRGRGDAWYDWIKNIFTKTGYTILERTPAEHDRMMSVVQALNHLNTIALGLAIAETGIPMAEISQFATPVFKAKMDIVKKVFTESPELYADIIARNPDRDNVLKTCEQVVRDIRSTLKAGDGAELKIAMEAAAKKLF